MKLKKMKEAKMKMMKKVMMILKENPVLKLMSQRVEEIININRIMKRL